MRYVVSSDKILLTLCLLRVLQNTVGQICLKFECVLLYEKERKNNTKKLSLKKDFLDLHILLMPNSEILVKKSALFRMGSKKS